jgi:hypothetical protein
MKRKKPTIKLTLDGPSAMVVGSGLALLSANIRREMAEVMLHMASGIFLPERAEELKDAYATELRRSDELLKSVLGLIEEAWGAPDLQQSEVR